MEDLYRRIGEGVTLVTIYPFDSCPTVGDGSAEPPSGTEEREEAPSAQLVDHLRNTVLEEWGGYPGSVHLIDASGKVVYKRTRLIAVEIVAAIGSLSARTEHLAMGQESEKAFVEQ